MKILKVKYKSHPILGDLELDFTNNINGGIYQNVIIVGENGTGKTSLLSSISTFLNEGTFANFDYIEYSVGDKKYKVEPLSDYKQEGFHKRTEIDTGIAEEINRNKTFAPDKMRSDPKDPRFYGCVFSKARADYKTQKIDTVKTSNIDDKKHLTDEEDSYTSLKQLLVDIKDQDEHDFSVFCKAEAHKWSDFETQTKTYRFENAFNSFFETIKFKGVETVDNEKRILFEKDGKNIAIDSLSTGEKQIVFRGAYLLRNSKNIYDGTVFIDEPELSMHPRWQKRILKYFTDLFTENGSQKCQIFIASHSDFVVESALERAKANHDTLVIILNNDAGRVNKRSIDGSQFVLSSITAAEVNYKAFNIYSTDLHIALFSDLERFARSSTEPSLVGLGGIERCDRYIEIQQEYQNNPLAMNSSFGQRQYHTLCTLIRNHIDHPDNPYTYNYNELQKSCELMVRILKRLKGILND